MRYTPLLALALAVAAPALVVSPQATAQTASEVRKQAEASLVLTGFINIGTEGQVEDFLMDKRDKVEPFVASFVEKQVQAWRFEPVVRDGKAVRARTPVTVRLGAKPNAEGGHDIQLLGANFQAYDPTATDTVTSVKLSPPIYPKSVYNMGGRGEVLLLVKVARDGTVMDVAVEQVNMKVYGHEQRMQRMRDELSRVSLAAARKWTFRAPTTGEDKDDPFWSIRVPVNFSLSDNVVAYGTWESYIPGPRQRAPWRDDKGLADEGFDLLPAGGVYMADSKGPRLLTRLGG